MSRTRAEAAFSDFGFRGSFGLRNSEFGFPPPRLCGPMHAHGAGGGGGGLPPGHVPTALQQASEFK